MPVTLPLMPWKLCVCSFEQASSLVFQLVGCDTIYLTQQCNLMRLPGSLCFLFESTRSYRISAVTFRLLVQLQHELYHELLAPFIEQLFRGLLVGISKLVCLAPASKNVALPSTFRQL